MKIRIGTLYRREIIKFFKKNKVDGPVLDVGCHKGEILDSIDAPLKVGVDIKFKNVRDSMYFVMADANHLPFKKKAFKQIFLLDVIEHIEDESPLSSSLRHALQPSGAFFITTPSKHIQIFPWFLTNFVSKKWGHYFRKGYSFNELDSLFKDNFKITKYNWNAQWWRTLYFLIRAMAEVSSSLSKKLVKFVFKRDSQHHEGNRGYLIIEGVRKNG